MNRTRFNLGYLAIAVIAALSWLIAAGSPAHDYPFVTFALIGGAIIVVLRPLYLVATRHPSPTKQLIRDLSAYREWIMSSLFLLLSITITLEASGALKKQIPLRNPFYLDETLANLDHAVFGVDGWQVTHIVIGPTGTAVIDLAYGLWHFVNMGLVIVIILMPANHFKIRAALAYQCTWLILGGFVATALSSAGPIFYDSLLGDDRFAGLQNNLQYAPGLLATRQYLLDTAGTSAIGGGISAMPSLHVSIAVLTALCAPSRLKVLGWAYALVIYIGSIHLGWHYASDGIVGASGVVAIWWASGRIAAKYFGPLKERSKRALS